MKILEFDTEIEAQTALDLINNIAAMWWASQGFEVVDDPESPSGKRVLGKNAATGETSQEGGTITWDKVKESPDGTFYFSSPVNKPLFADWRDHIPDGVSIPADKDMPESWIVTEEDV